MLIWAVVATAVGCMCFGYIIGSEMERYRNNESAMGNLADVIVERLEDK